MLLGAIYKIRTLSCLLRKISLVHPVVNTSFPTQFPGSFLLRAEGTCKGPCRFNPHGLRQVLSAVGCPISIRTYFMDGPIRYLVLPRTTRLLMSEVTEFVGIKCPLSIQSDLGHFILEVPPFNSVTSVISVSSERYISFQ